MALQAKFNPKKTLKAFLLATAMASSGLYTITATPAWAYVPPEGFADLVEQVSPAVVYIEVTSTQSGTITQDPSASPFDEFLKRFDQPGQNGQNGQQPDRESRGLGSGFIISSNGEIVTNHHVVENATKVTIKLQDGREFAANVVGSDKATDVALLKIDNVKDLPVVPFGPSDSLRVGDAVVAVGNPFGLGGTVTAGIISALGRDINFGPYDSYIQTDAAINRGNSGGPLFNTKGEVIGMNSAIFSPTGGSVGIGFSIPADKVQNIVDQLRSTGTVSRGWLGVQIQQITPDIAAAIGLATPKGAMVADVMPDSPAMAGGVKKGDVILAVNDSDVTKMHDLPTIIAAIPADTTVTLTVLRDGKTIDLDVKIGRLSPEKMQLASTQDQGPQAADLLGVTVQTLTPDIALQLGISDTDTGVVITSVMPKSRNTDKLLPGDVIQEAAGQVVTTPAELATVLQRMGNNPAVLLRINRRGTPLYVGAEINPS